jgi:hypothetical protein
MMQAIFDQLISGDWALSVLLAMEGDEVVLIEVAGEKPFAM